MNIPRSQQGSRRSMSQSVDGFDKSSNNISPKTATPIRPDNFENIKRDTETTDRKQSVSENNKGDDETENDIKDQQRLASGPEVISIKERERKASKVSITSKTQERERSTSEHTTDDHVNHRRDSAATACSVRASHENLRKTVGSNPRSDADSRYSKHATRNNSFTSLQSGQNFSKTGDAEDEAREAKGKEEAVAAASCAEKRITDSSSSLNDSKHLESLHRQSRSRSRTNSSVSSYTYASSFSSQTQSTHSHLPTRPAPKHDPQYTTPGYSRQDKKDFAEEIYNLERRRLQMIERLPLSHGPRRWKPYVRHARKPALRVGARKKLIAPPPLVTKRPTFKHSKTSIYDPSWSDKFFPRHERVSDEQLEASSKRLSEPRQERSRHLPPIEPGTKTYLGTELELEAVKKMLARLARVEGPVTDARRVTPSHIEATCGVTHSFAWNGRW